MNLKEMTAQEIFTKVKNHLLKQNARSITVDGTDCAYRGRGGLMCAAGCLIDDEDYSVGFEKEPWELILSNLPEKYNNHELLISNLQTTHDTSPPEFWVSELKKLAVKNNLKYDI